MPESELVRALREVIPLCGAAADIDCEVCTERYALLARVAAQEAALEKAEAALLAVQRHLEPKGFAFWCYWCHEGNIWSRHHSADCPLEPALAAIEAVKEARMTDFAQHSPTCDWSQPHNGDKGYWDGPCTCGAVKEATND